MIEIQKFCMETGIPENHPRLNLLIEKAKFLGHGDVVATLWWMYTLADLIKEPKTKSLCDCGAELHLDNEVVRCTECGRTFWMKRVIS